jgi:hypothetical protein
MHTRNGKEQRGGGGVYEEGNEESQKIEVPLW